MHLSLTTQGDLPVLSVSGDVDMATMAEFEAALETYSDGFRSPLVIDLAGCSFVDSGGLNVLLQTVRRLDDKAWIGVVNASRNLRRVFEIVALPADPRFRLLEDLPEAAR